MGSSATFFLLPDQVFMPHKSIDEFSKMRFFYVTYRYLRVQITFGDHNQNKEDVHEKTLEVRHRNVIIHPRHNRQTEENDIALITLDTPLNWKTEKHLRPVCLPTSPPTTGRNSVVMGWGDVKFGKYSRYHCSNPMQLS